MHRYLSHLIVPVLLLSLTETGFSKKPDVEVVIDMEKMVAMRPALPEDTAYYPRARTVIRLLGDSNGAVRYLGEDMEAIKRLLPTAAKVTDPAAR